MRQSSAWLRVGLRCGSEVPPPRLESWLYHTLVCAFAKVLNFLWLAGFRRRVMTALTSLGCPEDRVRRGGQTPSTVPSMPLALACLVSVRGVCAVSRLKHLSSVSFTSGLR